MKIYIPTEITTEAEAEALAHGTKVFHEDMSLRTPVPYLYVKRGDGSFVGWKGDILYLDEIVPCTALVEREVSVEYSTDESERRWSADGIYSTPEDVRRDGWTGPILQRHLTDWEDA